MVKITEAAGVGQGTFYQYFSGKQQIFDELVDDLNRRVRRAMSEAAAKGTTRAEKERLGFAAFFRLTAEHPALYRVIRQAEFVSPKAMHAHYERIVEGYAQGLRHAVDDGEIVALDPDVVAWVLMGIGEMIGLRWVLWGDSDRVPKKVLDEVIAFITRGLGA